MSLCNTLNYHQPCGPSSLFDWGCDSESHIMSIIISVTGITSECFKCYMSMVLNIVDLAAIYYTFNELINDLNTLMN